MRGYWREAWTTLPPLYKKRVYQGSAASLALMLSFGLWVGLTHDTAVIKRADSIAHISSDIRDAPSSAPAPTTDDIVLGPLKTTDDAMPAAEEVKQTGKIALIMTDLGLAQQTDARAISDLPSAIALAFSPYGIHSAQSVALARQDGHKALALIPMEPNRYPQEDPGPLALSERLTAQQKEQSLARIFAAIPKADGAMNFMGSRFLSAETNVDSLLTRLRAQNLLFIENPDSYQSAVKSVAQASNAPLATVDILIDNTATQAGIQARLEELERLGLERGIAVGVIHPLPLTFSALANWLPTLEQRQMTLVDIHEASRLQRRADASRPTAEPLPDMPAAPPPPPLPPAVEAQP